VRIFKQLSDLLPNTPEKRHISEEEERGIEPLTSAVQRRRNTLLELSGVYKTPANKRISALKLFLGFQGIYSGCCTVAAQVWKPGHG
jgi:hypothetical protein